MNQGQQIISCPKCGSNKIKALPGLFVLAIASFLTASIMIWIPVLGWIAAPIAVVLGIIFLVAGFFPKKHRNVQCVECKNNIMVTPEQYNEWKAL